MNQNTTKSPLLAQSQSFASHGAITMDETYETQLIGKRIKLKKIVDNQDETAIYEIQSISEPMTQPIERQPRNGDASESDIFPVLRKLLTDYSSIIQDGVKPGDDKFIDFIKDIEKCCFFTHDFDVYQVLSFESTKSNRDIITLWHYRFKCVKGILCALTQLFGMAIVLYQLISEGVSDKDWCWNFDSDTAYMNVLAFLLSTYLAYTTIRELGSMKGLYKYILLKDYNAEWIHHGWLYSGFIINTIAATAAVWGSFFIIFFSDSAIDMVLNCVALFFLVELDDLLVDDDDYEEIETFIKSYNHKTKKFELKHQKNKGICTRLFGKIADKIGDLILFVVGSPFMLIRVITLCGCVFCPIYIGICF
eukprot:451949_1